MEHKVLDNKYGKEDKFTKKYLTPLFSPFMKETKHIKSFG